MSIKIFKTTTTTKKGSRENIKGISVPSLIDQDLIWG